MVIFSIRQQVSSLIGGYHTILITVTDSEERTSSASAQVNVEALAAIELISPEKDAYESFDEDTYFSVIVRDGVDSIEPLQIDFSSTHSAILGSICTPIIDTEANTPSCSVALQEGLHNLTFAMTKSRQETISVEQAFQVYSPFQKIMTTMVTVKNLLVSMLKEQNQIVMIQHLPNLQGTKKFVTME